MLLLDCTVYCFPVRCSFAYCISLDDTRVDPDRADRFLRCMVRLFDNPYAYRDGTMRFGMYAPKTNIFRIGKINIARTFSIFHYGKILSTTEKCSFGKKINIFHFGFRAETSGFRAKTLGFSNRNFGFSEPKLRIFEPKLRVFEPKLRVFENRSSVFLKQSCSFCK
jgi:hypothetical protein